METFHKKYLEVTECEKFIAFLKMSEHRGAKIRGQESLAQKLAVYKMPNYSVAKKCFI